MSKTDEKFEFPGDREAGIIGTATRTRAQWKKNGNVTTFGKELKYGNQPGQTQRKVHSRGRSKVRRGVDVAV